MTMRLDWKAKGFAAQPECQRRLKSDPLSRLVAEVNLTHPGSLDRAARS
jgi:hypothetical protein